MDLYLHREPEAPWQSDSEEKPFLTLKIPSAARYIGHSPQEPTAVPHTMYHSTLSTDQHQQLQSQSILIPSHLYLTFSTSFWSTKWSLQELLRVDFSFLKQRLIFKKREMLFEDSYLHREPEAPWQPDSEGKKASPRTENTVFSM